MGVSRRKALKDLALGLALACWPGLARATGAGSGDPSAMDLAMQGQLLLAQGRGTEAVAALGKALSLEPESGWAWGLLGRAHILAGDPDQARTCFLMAVSLDPSDTYSQMMAEQVGRGSALPGLPGQDQLEDLEQQAQAERERFAMQGHAQDFVFRRVALDPGHGGFDPGAIGPTGLKEKDVALDIVRRTASLLERHAPGLDLLLTRHEDFFLPLSARTAAANQFGADLFVSLHVNAATRAGANGVETYFCSEQASSAGAERVARSENRALQYEDVQASPGLVSIEDILFRFERTRYWRAGAGAAAMAQARLVELLPGLENRGVHSANFVVLRKARMPAVLLETGFISHPREEARLRGTARRQEIAGAVAQAVVDMARQGVEP